MAKEAGVDLSEVFATFAKLPNGKNGEKEGKMGVFDDFVDILPNGKMAKVAKSPADTFSDKLDLFSRRSLALLSKSSSQW